jgi:hypothetical protein
MLDAQEFVHDEAVFPESVQRGGVFRGRFGRDEKNLCRPRRAVAGHIF